jgi:hypothetical protein
MQSGLSAWTSLQRIGIVEKLREGKREKMLQKEEFEKAKERLHKFALNYAKKKGYSVNEDKINTTATILF